MATEERPTFGELLRQHRLAAGLTQEALAERTGLSVRGLSDLERGARRVPHPDTVRRLVQVLNLSDTDRAGLQAVRTRHAAEGASGARRARSVAAMLAPLANFVGREHELGEVQRLLGGARLLTLTGTGGIGKTRLALQVAGAARPAFADGMVFVDLAPLGDPALVPQALAATIGLPGHAGRLLLDMLVDDLRPRQLLVVLDNCEHLLGACAELADHLLGTCARLTILATSREPLGIAGEVSWRVPTLAVPDPTEDASIECMAGRDAVRLFLERTSSVLPGFTLTQQNARAVSEVCRRLDGLPLAIELAAARVRVLGPEQIAERLDDRFRLLTGGSRTAPLRQQTLRATLEWSYDLLSDAERLLFDRLSVFAGGWTLETAEAVCAGEAVEPGAVLDVLTQLVDKSLVLAEPGPAGAIRYRLLETLRQYGQERLGDRDDVEETRRRHAVFFLALAERAARELRGSEQRSWLALLAHEQDNFRAALVWSIGRGESEIGPRLAAAPAEFWQRRAYVSKDLEWLLRGLEHGDVGSAAVRAPALQAAAFLAYFQGDDEAAHVYLAEGLALWQQLGEERGIADTLRGLGMTALGRGELDRAEAPLLASLDRFRALEDSLGIAACLGNLGDLAHARGDVTQAAALFEESLALAREQGNTWQAAYVLHSLGHLALVRGNQARATALLREGLALFGELEDRRAIAVCLDSLALVACGQRQPERAARLFGASEGLRAAMGVGRRAWLRVDFDRGVAAARAALGEAAFAAAWAAGRSLSAAQAIEYALGSDAPAADEPAQYAAPSSRAASRLTRREREVVALLARGLSNRQIAAALVIAEGTAANHVKHILARLGLDSRAQVATWAIEHGLHLPSPS